MRQPASDRRRQIAEAVLKIIGEQGVHRLTSQAIAREVGVTDGALFRHFKDKQAIVQAALDHFEALLAADPPPQHADPIVRLGQFFLQRLRLLERYPGFHRLVFSDRLEEAAGERGAAQVQAMMARAQAFVRGCLAEAQERGLVARDLSLDVLLWAALGVLRGRAAAPGKREAPEQIWQSLERLLGRSKFQEGGTH